MLHFFSGESGYSFSGSWPYLVNMCLEYRMHVYILIVVQKTVLTYIMEKWRIVTSAFLEGFRKSSHWRKQVSDLFMFTGWFTLQVGQ